MENEECKDKLSYISTAKEGTLIAFKDYCGKVKTAKVISNDEWNETIEAETAYGMKYTVKYESILWVKTGSRWQRGIYDLLKGKVKDEEN